MAVHNFLTRSNIDIPSYPIARPCLTVLLVCSSVGELSDQSGPSGPSDPSGGTPRTPPTPAQATQHIGRILIHIEGTESF